jgi:hypothetical protein
MGMWGFGPFENDGALDEVFDLQEHLIKKVKRLACGPLSDWKSIFRDAQSLGANVELLCMVAQAAYQAAVFSIVRGDLLPDAEIISEWRVRFFSRCTRLCKREFQRTPAELEQFALEAAAPLIGLAELSRQQSAMWAATSHEIAEEIRTYFDQQEAEEARRKAERDAATDQPCN